MHVYTYFVHSNWMNSVNTHLISRKNTIADAMLKHLQIYWEKQLGLFKWPPHTGINRLTVYSNRLDVRALWCPDRHRTPLQIDKQCTSDSFIAYADGLYKCLASNPKQPPPVSATLQMFTEHHRRNDFNSTSRLKGTNHLFNPGDRALKHVEL